MAHNTKHLTHPMPPSSTQTCMYPNIHQYISMISVGGLVAGVLQPPWLGRNLVDLYSFPERTIGNLGNDVTLHILAEMVEPR